ncbi:hypothetical protein [Nocardia panacis]|nr:hypothetical protein [Nocardia panacis]
MATRVAVGAVVVAGLGLAGAGVAAADPSGKLVTNGCQGSSPNIIDMPYSGQVIASQYNQAGSADISVYGGSSIFGYDTRPTLTWTNLNTGASGSVTGYARVGMPYTANVNFPRVPTGSGPVRIDVSVANSGFFPVPAVTCSGVVDLD